MVEPYSPDRGRQLALRGAAVGRRREHPSDGRLLLDCYSSKGKKESERPFRRRQNDRSRHH